MTSFYWGNEWALAVDFVLFILVLSFKPSGIFGSQRGMKRWQLILPAIACFALALLGARCSG